MKAIRKRTRATAPTAPAQISDDTSTPPDRYRSMTREEITINGRTIRQFSGWANRRALVR